jgi:hypothetical protein
MKPGKIVLTYFDPTDEYRKKRIIHRATDGDLLGCITINLTGAYTPKEAQGAAEWHLRIARLKYDRDNPRKDEA